MKNQSALCTNNARENSTNSKKNGLLMNENWKYIWKYSNKQFCEPTIGTKFCSNPRRFLNFSSLHSLNFNENTKIRWLIAIIFWKTRLLLRTPPNPHFHIIIKLGCNPLQKAFEQRFGAGAPGAGLFCRSQQIIWSRSHPRNRSRQITRSHF